MMFVHGGDYTCSRTLVVSSGIVTPSATHPARPALTNFTAIVGSRPAVDMVAAAVCQTALPPTQNITDTCS